MSQPHALPLSDLRLSPTGLVRAGPVNKAGEARDQPNLVASFSMPVSSKEGILPVPTEWVRGESGRVLPI